MRHHVLLQTGSTNRSTGRIDQSDIREAVSIAIEVCGDSARLSGNYVIAMKWWRRAAERGNPSAQMKLAYLYGDGRGGTATDYTQAYKWYDIAAAIVGGKSRWASCCSKSQRGKG